MRDSASIRDRRGRFAWCYAPDTTTYLPPSFLVVTRGAQAPSVVRGTTFSGVYSIHSQTKELCQPTTRMYKKQIEPRR